MSSSPTPCDELAWVDDGSRRLIARAPAGLRAHSAVTRLIQGLYAHDPAQARRLARLRIRATSSAPTPMCEGMLRVAAKRIDYGVARAEAEAEGGPPERIELARAVPPAGSCGSGAPPVAWLAADPMRSALALAAGVTLADRRHASARQIAALLIAASGEPLAWAVNASGANKTFHAEVNLVQHYCRMQGGGLPRGAFVLTTLQSCKMCAGMIWHSAEEPSSLRVVYAEPDPGPLARQTALTQLEKWRESC